MSDICYACKGDKFIGGYCQYCETEACLAVVISQLAEAQAHNKTLTDWLKSKREHLIERQKEIKELRIRVMNLRTELAEAQERLETKSAVIKHMCAKYDEDIAEAEEQRTRHD